MVSIKHKKNLTNPKLFNGILCHLNLCFSLNLSLHSVSWKDGEGGEEETKFDPGYEPDWAVISRVKPDRRQELPPVRETGTVLNCHLSDDVHLHFKHALSSCPPSFGRSVGLILSAPVGAVLPSKGSLLSGKKLLGADQQRGRSSPTPAFPSRGH